MGGRGRMPTWRTVALALGLALMCLAPSPVSSATVVRKVWRGAGRVQPRAVPAGRAAGGRAAGNPLLQNSPAPVQLLAFSDVTWRGWGTSLAWFANFIGQLPWRERDYLVDLLFSPKTGLGLNIVRYILPGGMNPRYSKLLATLPFQTAPYGFRGGAVQPYNWTADGPQRAILKGAVARGAIAEAISYSPPWWMTINGDVSGNPNGSNLAPHNFGAFVNYLADVAQYFSEVDNVTFVGINPFNEPEAGWWKGGGGQEGCPFPRRDQLTVLTMLNAALKRRRLLDTAVVGLDDWADRTNRTLEVLPEIWNQIKRVTFHGYQKPTYVAYPSRDYLGTYVDLAKMAKFHRKEIWMSEWGPQSPIPSNPADLDLAMVQSRSVCEFINIVGVSAFLHWQAILPTGKYYPPPYSMEAGMIGMPFDLKAPFKPVIRKQYYAMMQFSRYVLPGAKVLKITPGLARFVFATYDPNLKWLVIGVVNQHQVMYNLRFDSSLGLKVTSLVKTGLHATIYRTSATENCKLAWRGVVARSYKDLVGLRIMPRSVTTIIFTNVDVQ